MKKAYISPFSEVIEFKPEMLLETSASAHWGNQKGYDTMGNEIIIEEREHSIWPVEGDDEHDWSTL